MSRQPTPLASLDDDALLTPTEVAARFRVDPKTVGRWASAGRWPKGGVTRTPGNHRRYKVWAVRYMLERGEGDNG